MFCKEQEQTVNGPVALNSRGIYMLQIKVTKQNNKRMYFTYLQMLYFPKLYLVPERTRRTRERTPKKMHYLRILQKQRFYFDRVTLFRTDVFLVFR